MRGYVSIDDDKKESYLNNFFDAYWKDNIDLSDQSNIEKILNSMKIDSDIFFKDIKTEDIKIKLKNFTDKAFSKEVFGAPTFIVNEKIFWGQDRLEYALDEFGCN